MSSIPQNYCDENELIDCVQRFFSRHHVGKLLAKCNGIERKRCFTLFLCSATSSATFLSEEACICSNELALFKEDFSKNTFISVPKFGKNKLAPFYFSSGC